MRAAQDKSTIKLDKSVQTDESQRQQLAEQIEDLQQIIQSQVTLLNKKDQSITQKDETIEANKKEIQQLRELHKKEIQQQREESEKEKDRVAEELERAEEHIFDLELQLSRRNQPHPELRSREESRGNITLRWREGKKAPCKMRSFYNIAVDGNIAYLRRDKQIYAYIVSTCTWSKLPDCTLTACPLVMINNLLTLVGGVYTDKCTDKLLSLTLEGRGRMWTEVFPPMPTKRCASSALCTGTVLIVAGGQGQIETVLATVEVMNTDTCQWSTAVNLPEPTSCGSLVQVDDGHIYILGRSLKGNKSVYTCSVSALLQSCNSKSTRARLTKYLSLSNVTSVWSQVIDPPVTHSACVSLHGRLLIVGGMDSHAKPTSALHMYDPPTNLWQVISHMATPRYDCYATVLPDNQLMVVGGWTDEGTSNTVEIATFL